MNRKYGLVFVPLLLVLLLFITSACNTNKTSKISDMITNEQIDQLKEDGLDIFEGSNPPNVEGSYLADSQYCIYSSDGDSEWYTYDYYYNFTNQSGDTLTLAYNGGDSSDVSEGDIGYIMGEGQNFSVFVESNGTYEEISYTTVTVYSGTLDTDGIHDFEMGFILTKKSDDPYGYMMDVGDDRIFIEDDYLAEAVAWPYSKSGSYILSLGQGLSRVAAR
jgi:hypothetical protein